MTWWVHNLVQQGEIVLLLSWVFWVIFSICLHELAHGWAAIAQGDETPRELGRMTMNPLVHMGPMSLLVFALIGIAWGLMPTDPSRFRSGRQGRIIVAAAGPAMNVLLAGVSLTIGALWMQYGEDLGGRDLHENVLTFFWVGGFLNVILAGFNLLPVPPLDGSRILSGVSFRLHQLYQHPNAPLFGLGLIIVIFMTGAGGMFFFAAMALSRAYMDLVRAVLP
jgi:Zn-dependent protease